MPEVTSYANLAPFRLQASTYISFATAALFVYDYLLTFPDEVSLVWTTSWGLGKILFFLTRYPAFIDITLYLYYRLASSLSATQCQLVYESFAWMFFIGIIIAEVIMLLRVWALWGRARMATIFLGSIFVTSIIGSFVSLKVYAASRTYTIEVASPSVQKCYAVQGNGLVAVDFIVLMIFETLILIMTFIKCLDNYRRDSSSLLNICLRDGIIYFVSQLAISAANVIVLIVWPTQFDNFLTPVQRSLHSILSARIILTLRQAAVDTPGASEQKTMESIAFAPTDNTFRLGAEEAGGERYHREIGFDR